MADLSNRVRNLEPTIKEIITVGRTAGVSLAVQHRGALVYKNHFGRREISTDLKPNDDTIYVIASLSKAITALAIAILVERGDIQWETRVSEIVPEFQRADDAANANIIDLIAHRTGVSGADMLFLEKHQEFMMPRSEIVKTCNFIPAARGFRTGFKYNNWCYGLLAAVVEKLSGQSFADFVRDEIFIPLGMKRSTFSIPSTDNITGSHMVLGSGEFIQCPLPSLSDVTGLEAAGGCKSSLQDLLTLYSGILGAYRDQKTRRTTSTPGSPLKQLVKIFEPYNAFTEGSLEDEGYALGWVRVRLPGKMGRIGMNAEWIGMESMPVIGKHLSGKDKIVYNHSGNLVGALTNVHLIPDDDTVILVLSNTLGFADVPDCIGQLILEEMLNVPKDQRHDFAELARQAKSGLFDQWQKMSDSVALGKTNIPPSVHLAAYAGDFYNSARNFVLWIRESRSGAGLRMVVQGMENVSYDLLPYGGDAFYWPCDRDEGARAAFFPSMWPGLHIVRFHLSDDGIATSLSWQLDDSVEAERFEKLEKPPTGFVFPPKLGEPVYRELEAMSREI